MRFLSLLILFPALAPAQGIPLKSGAGADLATVNTNKALHVTRGKTTNPTYSCTATGLATSALYSMQLDAEAARGLRIVKICVGSSSATAAALQTITVQRRTTASSVGTAATAEGTASPSVSKSDPADSNYSGRCAVTPTLGTAGAVLDGWGLTVGEMGAGAADPSGPNVFCRTYGDQAEKPVYVQAGTANGISVVAAAVGAGGLASGSITIVFIAE